MINNHIVRIYSNTLTCNGAVVLINNLIKASVFPTLNLFISNQILEPLEEALWTVACNKYYPGKVVKYHSRSK